MFMKSVFKNRVASLVSACVAVGCGVNSIQSIDCNSTSKPKAAEKLLGLTETSATTSGPLGGFLVFDHYELQDLIDKPVDQITPKKDASCTSSMHFKNDAGAYKVRIITSESCYKAFFTLGSNRKIYVSSATETNPSRYVSFTLKDTRFDQLKAYRDALKTASAKDREVLMAYPDLQTATLLRPYQLKVKKISGSDYQKLLPTLCKKVGTEGPVPRTCAWV